MPSLKIVDAKVTHVNGGLTISWKMSDDSWTEPANYTVPIGFDTTDQNAIKQWCQDYKAAYNAGKDKEEEEANQQIPTQVLPIIDQPLNLN